MDINKSRNAREGKFVGRFDGRALRGGRKVRDMTTEDIYTLVNRRSAGASRKARKKTKLFFSGAWLSRASAEDVQAYIRMWEL